MATDWHFGKLTLSTLIDDDFSFTQNVKIFLEAYLKEEIHLSRSLVITIKKSRGITLQEVINEYLNKKA